MSIEASLPMLLAIFGVNCSVFGVNTLVMGRLCRSKGIELSRQDIRLPDCAGCNLGIVSNRCKSRSCVDCT